MSKDFFSEFKKEELERLKISVEKARGAVLKDHFPSLSDKSPKEIENYTKLLDRLEGILLMAAEEFFKHLPSPLEQIRERSKWEVYLSGLRFILRRYSKGFFRKTVLALKEWRDFPEKIDSYSGKCLEGVSDFLNWAREVEKYCKNYKSGLEIAEQYKDWHDDLVSLYASLKTWETEKEFRTFEDYFRTAERQFIEVIIEGPVQLYLFIGEETWFLIFKIVTAEFFLDLSEDKNKKELKDLRDFHQMIYHLVENSGTYKTFKKFVGESAKLYIDDYLKEAKLLRTQYPTEELRKKFIRRFESGEIFKKIN